MITEMLVIKKWMKAAGIRSYRASDLDKMEEQERELFANMILEEAKEAAEAIKEGKDIKHIGKELVDTYWVVLKAALGHGIPLQYVFKEVAKSNMSKLRGMQKNNKTGKVMKGPYYKKADLSKVEEVKEEVVETKEEITKKQNNFIDEALEILDANS